MLFFLDSSLADYINENPDQHSDVLDAVEHIARARREGKHLVFAERRTLAVLSRCSISPVAKNVYSKLYSRLPQDKSYFDQIPSHVEVVADESVFIVTEHEGKRILRIAAKYFVDFSLTSETILLTENQSDIAFYEKVVRVYLSWVGLGKTVINFEPRSGGGNTIAVEYRVIQERKNRFCLCIVDGDLKAPNLSLGDTAKAVQNVDNPNQPLCFFHPIMLREIENIIPTSIYKAAVGHDVNKEQCISFLEQIEQSESAVARRHLDIKKGIRLKDVLSNSTESPLYKFWLTTLRAIDATTVCFSDTACTRREQCTCVITSGLGARVLEAVNVLLREKPDVEIADMVDHHLRGDWEEIGALLLSWCCGSSRLITT